uniref:Small nuclear ribonucleoprotein G n=1 Tax=Parastrongyloides trichosuri TaxID=131310 RepID=A0A0N5A1S9_PARTI
MSRIHPPELNKYLNKFVDVKLTGNRHVSGTLRGFDSFMNIIIEGATEHLKSGETKEIGIIVLRGNSVVIMEPRERIE